MHHNTTHGETGANLTPEFTAWCGMKDRCYNKNAKAYKHYGAKGIIVCKTWLKSYTNFLKDMGRRPSPKHTLERKNVRKNYSPSNCEWATWKTQANNKTNNVILTYDGKKMNIGQWSSVQGIKRSTIEMRLRYGWSVEKALTKPVQTQRRKQIVKL